MSTRDALLAVLTLGPAYGYQLHAEVIERTEREAPLNVGQIYSTLDRLRRDGLVVSAGTSADGLPLYALTTEGLARAESWLVTAGDADWSEMVEQVLVARSLPGNDPDRLVEEYRALWRKTGADLGTGVSTSTSIGTGTGTDERGRASALLASAALQWLDGLDQGAPWPLRTNRPKRGRRAAAVKAV